MNPHLFKPYTSQNLTTRQARKLAREHGVRLPRVGYEISLGNGLWLASTGHADFGWFESTAPTPFRLHGFKEEDER